MRITKQLRKKDGKLDCVLFDEYFDCKQASEYVLPTRVDQFCFLGPILMYICKEFYDAVYDSTNIVVRKVNAAKAV